MEISVSKNERELGRAAAQLGAAAIREAARSKDRVTIVFATGASQFSMLEYLAREPGIAWDRVDGFHLDEYVGISATHAASFRKYLHERLVSKVENLGVLHEVAGDARDLDAEVARLNALIGEKEVDICFAGIGENGHLAFNDPPADFAASDPYIVVGLDRACRQQQCNEGWFDRWENVPSKAVTMSVKQIMKSSKIVVCASGERKAVAVKNTLTNSVSPKFPASILQGHSDCHVFLDAGSANLL